MEGSVDRLWLGAPTELMCCGELWAVQLLPFAGVDLGP